MTSNATWCDAQGHSAIAEVALVAFYSHGFMRLIYTYVHVSSSLQISVLLETQACISHDLVTNHRHQHCMILYSCVVHFFYYAVPLPRFMDAAAQGGGTPAGTGKAPTDPGNLSDRYR